MCFSSDVLVVVVVVGVKSSSISADFNLVAHRALILRLATDSICHARAAGLDLTGGGIGRTWMPFQRG